MEKILEGNVLCDDYSFGWVVDPEETVFIRCNDIGNYLGIKKGGIKEGLFPKGCGTSTPFFIANVKRRFTDLATIEKVFYASRTRQKEGSVLVKRLKEAFFGSKERKFVIPRKGRHVEILCIGELLTIRVDKKDDISLEEAHERHPELSSMLKKFEKIFRYPVIDKEEENSSVSSYEKGFVYILKDIAGKEGNFKVGKTTNLNKRLATYSSGSSQEQKFETVFETENCDLFERCMHYMFDASRQGKKEMFRAPLPALDVVGRFVKRLDEIRELNEKHLLSDSFDERAYMSEFDLLFSGSEAKRKRNEKQAQYELKVQKKLAKIRAVKSFVEEYGHLPTKTEDKSLANFLVKLRRDYANRKAMNFDKRVISEASNIPKFSWRTREAYFDTLLNDLDEWLENNKCELTVLKNKTLYERLNSWKKNYRVSLGEKDGEYELLQQLFASHGVIFMCNTREEKFVSRVEELRSFLETSNGKLPKSSSSLGEWLRTQRELDPNGIDTERKISILDEVVPGWRENRHETKWCTNFKIHIEYVKRHGHLPPKSSHRWMTNQRSCAVLLEPRGSLQPLHPEKIKLLEEAFPGWRDTKNAAIHKRPKNCEACAEERKGQ